MKQRISRREFLKTAAIGVGITALSGTGVVSLATRTPPVNLYELESTGKMEDKILITYASRYGSTAEIAREMAKVFEKYGQNLDVYPIHQVKDISAYHSIIVGSAVQRAQWLPEAVKFVKDNRLLLRRIPTAYFTVCLTMAHDNDANRQKAQRFLDEVHEYNHADLEGYFGGLLDFKRMSWLDQTIMKSRGRDNEGDYRDWNAIQAWTDNAYHRLLA